MDPKKLETIVNELSKIDHNIEYIQAILNLRRTRPNPNPGDEASDKSEMLLLDLTNQSLTLMAWAIKTLEREQQRAAIKVVGTE